MDVQSIISDAKARFAHNAAKEYLREKYSDKLTIADQGGLWKADQLTISALNSFDDEKIVLIDIYNNPVEVDRLQLLEKLKELYNTVMNNFYKEWKELESKK